MMTVVEGVAEQHEVSRRRRWAWIVALCAGILVAAGVPSAVWFAHWRSSLHSLVDYPTYRMGGPLAVGDTEYLGGNVWSAAAISHPHQMIDLSMHVSSIHPIVVANTADADIRILRCVLALDGEGPVGGASGDSRCASISPFRSGDITVGFKRGDDDIVIAVTPGKSGRVRIRGVEVDYSSGLRHGTQHTGVQIDITTP